jgi:16S rRNA (cytosine967-C5)-methyltransferase
VSASERLKAHANVREHAADILAKVEAQSAYTDILLDRTLRSAALSQPDGALLTELCYGTLRWRGRIDIRLAPLMSQPLNRAHPFIRNLLRITVYQTDFLDRIPDYAAVNVAVELAKARRGVAAARFVNAILRRHLREKGDGAAPPELSAATLEGFSNYWSHPEWVVRHWRDYLGSSELAGLLQANNRPAPLVLRANLLKTNRHDLAEFLCRRGISVEAGRWSPQAIVLPFGYAVEQLPGFRDGLFQVQGEASQLIAYLLAPQPGERILDACAAPGGKTTHIAELAGDCGEIIASDIARSGLLKIEENFQRLGLRSIRTLTADATVAADRSEQPYDRILVDAPCSGFGTLRSHPEIKWQRREADVQRLSRLQRRILMGAIARLKPGGVLVYSTCTLIADENERVVQQLLKDYDTLVLEDAADYLPAAARAMVRDGYFSAWPHRHGTDGFFAARLRKRAGA